MVISVSWTKDNTWPSEHGRRCSTALGLVQVVAIAFFICMTAAQGSLALAVRRHGKESDRCNRVEQFGAVEYVDSEKGNLVAWETAG